MGKRCAAVLGQQLRQIRLDFEQYREAATRLKAADDWLQGTRLRYQNPLPVGDGQNWLFQFLNDYLLAHTFAVIGAARGRKDATWIAAATLDRYLINAGQKQIYGTQFKTPNDGLTTQEPYDRSVVSDALRAALGVPPLNEQEKQRQKFQAELKGQTGAKR